MPNATRILVLGQSNSGGAQLGDPSEAWPNILANSLPSLLGSPVDLTFRTFYAHASGANAYLARELARERPDVAILVLAPFAFHVAMVGHGVRRRYGERVGNAYQLIERRFARASRAGGTLGSAVDRLARRLAHAILGAAPVASYDAVIEGTAQAMRTLAREEQIHVVALQGFIRVPSGNGAVVRRRRALLRRFIVETRALTEQLHVTYLELPQGTLQSSDEFFLSDSTHLAPNAHRAIAATILGAFTDGRIPTDPE
ncbi:MAG: hypothetical protein ABIP13_00890 [Tepidiformaceae bacterium]